MMASTPAQRGGAADRPDLVARHLRRARCRCGAASRPGSRSPARRRRGRRRRGSRACRAGSRTARRGSGRRAGPGRRSPRSGGRRRPSGSSGTKSWPSLQPVRRRRARVVEREHARGEERRVEAVGDRVDRHRGDDEPGARQRLAARGRDDRERVRRRAGRPRSSPARGAASSGAQLTRSRPRWARGQVLASAASAAAGVRSGSRSTAALSAAATHQGGASAPTFASTRRRARSAKARA